jgi:hypothetical protein
MPSSSLRRLLEHRVWQLLADADELADQSAQRAVSQCADRLNQSVRRIRQAGGVPELITTVADAAASFGQGAAVFEIQEESAFLRTVRGVDTEELPAHFEISLSFAPALAGVLESRDPVTAAAEAGQVSPAVMELLGHAAGARVSIFPMCTGEKVAGLLYTWGATEPSALELLAQVAGAVWASVAPPPRVETAPLVSIAAAATAETAPSRGPVTSWDSLSPDEQQVHLRAQRFARVQVAQMRLFESEAVQAGRTGRDLYGKLRNSIDSARQTYRERFFAGCPSMLDYLHLEMVRTLAQDDAELLGAEYPGPLV